MSVISGSRRFTAVLAALALLLAVPLGAPAFADPGHVEVSVLLDSPEVMALINDGSASATPPDILYEVFDAAGDGQEPVKTQTAPGGFGEVASFDLGDGSYKIRATTDG